MSVSAANQYSLRPETEMPVSRSPPRTRCVLSDTVGAMPSTWPSASSVSRFSSVRPLLRSLPEIVTVSCPAPMPAKESEIDEDTPEIVVISAMTAVTPIMMPRMVRNERMRFLRMSDRAMRAHSKGMRSPVTHACLFMTPPRFACFSRRRPRSARRRRCAPRAGHSARWTDRA